jgi:hypothetical protein
MTLVLKVLSVIVSPNNAQHQERFVGSWKEERDVRDDSKHVVGHPMSFPALL